MTADERLEALLNRAGQTITDLPRSFAGGPEAYGEEARKNALCAAWSWYLPAVISAGDAVDFMWNRRNETVMAQYILHLTDVIDRMETALENVCGERDYLRHAVRVDGCWTCTNSDSGPECHSDSRIKEARAIVVERESPFKGYPINLYVCAKCNRPIRPGDLYCGKCGGKLVFTDQNEDTKQKETEAEHVTD